MQLSLEPKAIEDVYRTPLVQQTAFWSRVKATLGMKSRAFEFSVRNSDIYTGVGGCGPALMRTWWCLLSR